MILIRLVVGFAEAASFPVMFMCVDRYLEERELTSAWSFVDGSVPFSSVLSGPIGKCIRDISEKKWRCSFSHVLSLCV